MSNSQIKPGYTERYYDDVDRLYNEWRRPVWDGSLGDVEQEKSGQIGASGWVEVLDTNGDTIVRIDQDGIVWLHADTHENGGSDEIDITGLSGISEELALHLADTADAHDASAISLADVAGNTAEVEVEGAIAELYSLAAAAITDHGALSGLADDDHPQYATNTEFDDHSARHENAGADEISVTGLSGLLADAQTPLAHAGSHEDSGTDEIDVTGLSGLLADAQTPTAHASTHEDAGVDEISIAGLAGTSIELAAHLADEVDAHDASAISLLDAGGNTTETEVEGAIAELYGLVGSGGGTIEVQESGGVVVAAATALNFGTGLDVTEPVSGEPLIVVDILELPDFTAHSTRHEVGGLDVINGDISPANILMPNTGEIDIGDVTLLRGAADRLDIASGDSVRLLGGMLTVISGGSGVALLAETGVGVYGTLGDTQAMGGMNGSSVQFGPGGSTAPDTILERESAGIFAGGNDGTSIHLNDGGINPSYDTLNHFGPSEAMSSYPEGMSMMGVTAGGGWPGSGILVTFRFQSTRANQIYLQFGVTNLMQYRQWKTAGGDGWTSFATA